MSHNLFNIAVVVLVLLRYFSALSKPSVIFPAAGPQSISEEDGETNFEGDNNPIPEVHNHKIDDYKRVEPGELQLPPGYNKLVVPKGTHRNGNEYEPARIHLNIRAIGEIDEINEEMTLESDFIIGWFDLSLLAAAKFDETARTDEFVGNLQEKILDPLFLKKIWKPDICVENLIEIKQPSVMSIKPARLKLASNGEMTYSSRITVKIKCNFDFKYYPADTQKCSIIVRSYSHTNNELELKWRKPVGVYLLKPKDDNFDVAVGEIRRVRLVIHVDRNKLKNETFDALEVAIFARRKLSYHLYQTYLPSMLYVGITWLCFMVPKRMIEARLAIVMTTLLTLTSMFASVRESTPIVSYTKAIDIWMVVCITFVFSVLLEFSILLWTDSVKNDEEQKKTNDKDTIGNVATRTIVKAPKKFKFQSIRQKIGNKVFELATISVNFLEKYYLILILNIFTIFIGTYWSWLFISSGYFDWRVNRMHNAIIAREGESSISSSISSNDEIGDNFIVELEPF